MRADLVGLIIHNKANDKACFFDSAGSASLVSPTTANADSYWKSPATVDSQGVGNCHRCHANDPILATPEIIEELSELDLINNGRDLLSSSGYHAVGTTFSDWNTELQSNRTYLACADGCHLSSTSVKFGNIINSMLSEMTPEPGEFSYYRVTSLPIFSGAEGNSGDHVMTGPEPEGSGGATEAQRLGVAVINLNPYDVAPEGTPRGTRGAFYSVYPGSRAGLLAAWAWGASRIIDVLEDDPSLLDPNYMAVTGCSRFGKAAFTAGALDARIKLTMPIESGVGGTSALKLIFPTNGGEKPYHAISYEHWFSPTALGPFASSNNDSSGPDRLPVDIHEVMGLVAPRGLYIVANPSSNYAGLNVAATNATAKVGKEIYKALGYEENLTFVGASGGHCQWRSGYTAQLRENVNKFLKPNGSGNTGVFTTDRADTDPSQWVDWTTPTLSGQLQ